MNANEVFILFYTKGGIYKVMKRLFALFIIAALVLSLGACAKKEEPGTGTSTVTSAPTTPGIITSSPGTATGSPGLATPSPGTATKSPGAATKSPGAATKSPGEATATATATSKK